MAFIDFAELKDKLSFGETINLLELGLKRSGNQYRGPCPACGTGGDRALVVTEGKGFFCFAEKKGGDQIALAAHILGIGAKDAAQELARRAGACAFLTPLLFAPPVRARRSRCVEAQGW